MCDHQEVKDLLAYLHLAVRPNDLASFKRAIAAPRRGVGDATVSAIAAFAATAGVSLLAACGRIVAGEKVRGVGPAVWKAMGPFLRAVQLCVQWNLSSACSGGVGGSSSHGANCSGGGGGGGALLID